MTVMYDTLDAQLARPAHRNYDRVREQFFAGHNLSYPCEDSVTLADAERHAEASGWAARWTRNADGYLVELLDRESMILASRQVNSTADQRHFARVLEAHLAAVARRGDPHELFRGWE
jgi:hypothetical protein